MSSQALPADCTTGLSQSVYGTLASDPMEGLVEHTAAEPTLER
jgi:hypothetical protein